jgi:hypothetical protein
MTHLRIEDQAARRLHGSRMGVVQWAGQPGRRLAHSAPGGQRLAGRVIESHTSLGCEHHDVRLCYLGRSLMISSTSADLRREVVFGLLGLPCFSPSQCIPCTNRVLTWTDGNGVNTGDTLSR